MRKVAAVAVVVGTVFLGACSTAQSAPPTTATPKSHSILLKVMSWGTDVNIDYSTPTGSSQLAGVDASNNWTMSFRSVGPVTGYGVSSTNVTQGGGLWSICSVTVDGKVVSSNQADYTGAQASCTS